MPSVDIDTGTVWDPETGEVRSTLPYDFGEAKAAHARGSRDQADAAENTRAKARAYAKAEKDYRIALAIEIVKLHDKDGVAWSAAPDLAKGDQQVANLR